MWALRHVSHPCRAQTDPPGRWISEAPLCLKGHLLLLGINSEWAVRASEKLSKDPAMSPSPATLFIARPAQMSIIYADTCKDCCHINNCVAKTEKKTTTTHQAKRWQRWKWAACSRSARCDSTSTTGLIKNGRRCYFNQLSHSLKKRCLDSETQMYPFLRKFIASAVL